MLRFASYVFGAGLALAATSASALIVPPACSTYTGQNYWSAQALSGGLTLYTISEGYRTPVTNIRLANCAAGSEVNIQLTDAGDPVQVRNAIYRMIADTQSYTFDDVAARFQNGPYTSIVQTIPADGCVCAIESN